MSTHRYQRLAGAVALAATLTLGASQVAWAVHAVKVHGSITIPGTRGMDLDRGQLGGGSSRADIKFNIVIPAKRYVSNVGTAGIKLMAGQPTYAQCSTANPAGHAYDVNHAAVGSWFCVRTQQGRYARFRIDHVAAYPGGMDITFTTWV